MEDFLPASLIASGSCINSQREAFSDAARNGGGTRRGGSPAISFAKVLHKTAALRELLAMGGDLNEPAALEKWIKRILDDLETSVLIQKRKPRS